MPNCRMTVIEFFYQRVYSSSLPVGLSPIHPRDTDHLSLSLRQYACKSACPRLSQHGKQRSGIKRLLCSSCLIAQLRLVFLSIAGASSVCSSSVNGVHGGGGSPTDVRTPWQWAASWVSWSASPSLSCNLLMPPPPVCARCSAAGGIKSLARGCCSVDQIDGDTPNRMPLYVFPPE
jgi:hypothetical protein